MRWVMATLFVVSAVAMGCSAGPSKTGNGEGGQPEWGNNGAGGSKGNVPLTSVASSSSSAAQVSSSSSSGGSSTCDNNAQGCQGCQQCAFSQVCGAEANACFNDTTCNALAMCLQNCADQMCADKCATMYQAGISAYNAAVECIFCKGCYNDCNGAAQGCP